MCQPHFNFFLSRKSNAPRRVCFVYVSHGNDTVYEWTVDTAKCRRDIRPGQAGVFKFNTTKLGEIFVNERYFRK